MIQKILCFLGFHWKVYQEAKTGIYLQIENYRFTGRIKCFICGKKLREPEPFERLFYKGEPVIGGLSRTTYSRLRGKQASGGTLTITSIKKAMRSVRKI